MGVCGGRGQEWLCSFFIYFYSHFNFFEQALSPTIVVMSPLILERIHNIIEAQVAGGSFLRRWLFEQAMKAGFRNFDEGQIGAPPFWNTLVFRGIQEIAGGRLRLVVTGSAPLASHVRKIN